MKAALQVKSAAQIGFATPYFLFSRNRMRRATWHCDEQRPPSLEILQIIEFDADAPAFL